MTIVFFTGELVRLATVCSALGVIALGIPSSAYAALFMYLDAQGFEHFSNVPSDPRYQVLLPDEGSDKARAPTSVLRPSREGGRERYARLVSHAAADTGLPENLLHAVIKAESNYNADAVSPKGAVGLMQLMPDTAKRYGVLDVRDPAANVLGGARYLKTLLAQFDADLALALAAYNAGPAAVLRSGRALPPYAETQRYVPRVLALYRSYIDQ